MPLSIITQKVSYFIIISHFMFFPLFSHFQKVIIIENFSRKNLASDRLVSFHPFSFQLLFYSSEKRFHLGWNHCSIPVHRFHAQDEMVLSLMAEEKPRKSRKTPFSAHIKEIWVRTLFLIFSLLFSFLILLFFWKEMVYLFTTPMACFGRLFLSTHLSEPFYATLKICTALGLFLNYPLILYHLYSFFLPSLYKREKRGWDPIFYCSILFFLLCMYFTSILILPILLQFFFQFEVVSGARINSLNLQNESEFSFSRNPSLPDISNVGLASYIRNVQPIEESWESEKIKEYLTKENPTLCENSFFKSHEVGGGLRILLEPRIDLFVHWSLSLYLLSFFISQTPLLLFSLFQRGFFRSSWLGKNRNWSLLIFLFLSAFLSPPDFFTQLLLFLIFYLFFEISLWTLFFLEEKRKSSKKGSREGFEPLVPASTPPAPYISNVRSRFLM
jgi:Sec-independent protein secretion pathway component TatC